MENNRIGSRLNADNQTYKPTPDLQGRGRPRYGEKLRTFLKDWTLIIAIVAGVAGYFVYRWLPGIDPVRPYVYPAIGIIQPLLIFAMLFLTFCRIELTDLRLQRWHLLLLLFQGGLFCGIGVALIAMPHSGLRVVLEGAMICLICPTATAGAVITKKLGGDVSHITTYTILINLTAAILIPLLVPFVHPSAGMGVVEAGLKILLKVFPLLLLPLITAAALKHIFPHFIERIAGYQEVTFYLWAIALALATAVTTRSIVLSHISLSTQFWLVAVSLVCCLLQFWLGRKIGEKYGAKITAGQSLGQKNTVLAIWVGYSFFTPVTAIVGGFYSIWHNLFNSWQLYNHKKHHSGPEEDSSSMLSDRQTRKAENSGADGKEHTQHQH